MGKSWIFHIVIWLVKHFSICKIVTPNWQQHWWRWALKKFPWNQFIILFFRKLPEKNFSRKNVFLIGKNCLKYGRIGTKLNIHILGGLPFFASHSDWVSWSSLTCLPFWQSVAVAVFAVQSLPFADRFSLSLAYCLH